MRKDFETARKLVDEFRKKSIGCRKAFPEEVKKVVLDLVDQYSPYLVSKELNLSSSILYQWKRKRNQPMRIKNPPVNDAEFVELPKTTRILESPTASNTSDGLLRLNIEISRPDGNRMRLDGSIASAVLVNLIRDFSGSTL